MNLESIKNKKLLSYLKKRKNQGTVILCFKILLDNAIANGARAKMLKSDINKEFDKRHKRYGVGTFRSDYLLRQSSSGELNAIGVESDNRTFFINEEFIEGLETKDLIYVSEIIKEHFERIISKQEEFYLEIESYEGKTIEERRLFIESLLLTRETQKKGQAFEIASFAILKTFYKVRGFELNRFSTVYSNDGGIDFTSQIAVYQVTTDLSPKKFEEDLKKAPLKKRVFVFKKASASFDIKKFDNDLVLDYISSDDLINHLQYLISKKPQQNSILILSEILNEFKREYYI